MEAEDHNWKALKHRNQFNMNIKFTMLRWCFAKITADHTVLHPSGELHANKLRLLGIWDATHATHATSHHLWIITHATWVTGAGIDFHQECCPSKYELTLRCGSWNILESCKPPDEAAPNMPPLEDAPMPTPWSSAALLRMKDLYHRMIQHEQVQSSMKAHLYVKSRDPQSFAKPAIMRLILTDTSCNFT